MRKKRELELKRKQRQLEMEIEAMRAETELADLRDQTSLKMQEMKLQSKKQKALVMGQLLIPV